MMTRLALAMALQLCLATLGMLAYPGAMTIEEPMIAGWVGIILPMVLGLFCACIGFVYARLED